MFREVRSLPAELYNLARLLVAHIFEDAFVSLLGTGANAVASSSSELPVAHHSDEILI